MDIVDQSFPFGITNKHLPLLFNVIRRIDVDACYFSSIVRRECFEGEKVSSVRITHG